MNVHLLAGKLPVYSDLIKYPPNSVVYSNHINDMGLSEKNCVSSYYNSYFYNLKRKAASLVLNTFQLPFMIYIPKHDADLIHSTRGILILNRTPWVIDIDYVGYFLGNNINKRNNVINKRIVNKILTRTECKCIICWSKSAKKSILSIFNSADIDKKLEIVYPAIPLAKSADANKDESVIKLLYISSSFATKGGEETLKSFELLTKKYDNLELIFKCDVSDAIKQKYSLKNIHYFPYRSQLLLRDDLINEFYMNSNIFLYPSLNDLFGLSLLDAMSVGLPIVSTNTFAIPEIVEDGRNGFLIEPYYRWYDKRYLPKKSIYQSQYKRDLFINQIVEKLSILIEDKKLRVTLGMEGRRLVEKGKFSITQRNARLKAIYESSIP